MTHSSMDGPPSFCKMTSRSSSSSWPWLFVLILISSIFKAADACFRRSAPPIEPVTAVTTPRMSVETVHKLECTHEQYYRQGCLHGGKCFAIKTGNGYTLGCRCTASWTSKRCERVYIDPKIYAVQQSNMRTANIAAGVSVCIILALVVLVAIWVYDRLRRKHHRSPCSSEENHNDRCLPHTKWHGETSKEPQSRITCLNETPLCENDELQAAAPLVHASTKDPQSSPIPAYPSAPRVSRFTVVTET